MKNEHIIWAYAPKNDGTGNVLIIGLTKLGLEYLSKFDMKSLVIQTPMKKFADITDVLVFAAETKEKLKEELRKTGLVVSELS